MIRGHYVGDSWSSRGRAAGLSAASADTETERVAQPELSEGRAEAKLKFRAAQRVALINQFFFNPIVSPPSSEAFSTALFNRPTRAARAAADAVRGFRTRTESDAKARRKVRGMCMEFSRDLGGIRRRRGVWIIAGGWPVGSWLFYGDAPSKTASIFRTGSKSATFRDAGAGLQPPVVTLRALVAGGVRLPSRLRAVPNSTPARSHLAVLPRTVPRRKPRPTTRHGT